MVEFEVPEFLQNNGTDERHARMLRNIPAKFDKTEGGIPWDLTYPAAAEISETVEFTLVELVRNLFPMWAEGKMLDEHGKVRALTRRAAAKATGVVEISGTVGHVIPAGTLLSTTSDEDTQTVMFVTLQEGVIASNGIAEVAVEAVEAGAVGNVAAGRINRLNTTDPDVLSLTNPTATSGGLDIEDDESYRERLTEYDKTQGESYIGSYADYKRWALSVSGVGGASVLPATDDSGEVQIIITDAYGNPASPTLCEAVYDYIMQPNNPAERLAPINAILNVKAVTAIAITISANVVTDGVRAIESIKQDFVDALKRYYTTAIEDGEIKYSEICAMLIDTEGVYDYSNVRINGGTSNVTVDAGSLPYTDADSVTLTIAE